MKFIGKLMALVTLVGALCLSVKTQTCPAAPVISTPANTAAAGGTFNNSNITIFNSDEAGPDTIPNRTTVDTYDDAWRAGSMGAGVSQFSTAWTGGAAGPFVNGSPLFTFAGVTVSLSSLNMDAALETGSHPCAGTSLTANTVLSGSGGTSMQDISPRPAQLAGVGTYLDASTVGSATTRNALRFEFSLPVRSFGAWFGDVETRTDTFGRPAIVRLLDASNNVIGQDVLVGTTTAPLTQPTACDSSQTTPPDPPGLVGCGSRTTRFIGFVDNDLTARVSTMLVIVGDADAGVTPIGNPNGYNGTPEGGTEFLSVIGATLARVAIAANASISGRVVTSSGRGIARTKVTTVNIATSESRIVFTNAFGHFRIADLPVGHFYNVTVEHKRYEFSDGTRLINLTEDSQDNIFVANDF